MTDSLDHIGPPDDDTLAAEYALGVLAGAERSNAERRIARDGAFARLVADWEARLTPLAGEIAPVEPPLAVWTKIAAGLPAQRAESDGVAGRLRFWRGLAFGTGGLALASVAALFFVIATTQPKPTLVASIDGGGHRHFIATVDPSRGTLAVVPAAFAADATRVAELWLIAPGDKPRSLGLLRADRAVTIAIPRELAGRATDAATLAVSLEPACGSPTGAPTGPVIAQGKLTAL